MKWFRFYSETIDDPKVHQMSDSCFRTFVNLLCLASNSEVRGEINLSNSEVAWRLRTHHHTVEASLKKLEELNIISRNGRNIKFLNWDKRQYKSDSSAERTRKWREGKERHRDVTVTPPDTDTDTDIYTSPKGAVCPHQEIVNLYHSTLPELPKVKIWSETRKKTLRARWKSNPKYQDLDWWKRFMESVKESPFLMGKNEKGWKADLEWLITEKNFIKVVEGKYLK